MPSFAVGECPGEWPGVTLVELFVVDGVANEGVDEAATIVEVEKDFDNV